MTEIRMTRTTRIIIRTIVILAPLCVISAASFFGVTLLVIS